MLLTMVYMTCKVLICFKRSLQPSPAPPPSLQHLPDSKFRQQTRIPQGYPRRIQPAVVQLKNRRHIPPPVIQEPLPQEPEDGDIQAWWDARRDQAALVGLSLSKRCWTLPCSFTEAKDACDQQRTQADVHTDAVLISRGCSVRELANERVGKPWALLLFFLSSS